MSVNWNPHWSAHNRPPAAQQVSEHLKAYAEALGPATGVIAVWAAARENSIDFYTLIKPDDNSEREVYEAEQRFYEKVPAATVRFKVYRDEKPLREQVKDAEPALIAA